MTSNRLAHLLLAVTLTAPCAAPSAHAVSPPPADQKWLPAPALPSPPGPTVQHEVCAVTAADPAKTGVPTQLGDLDLPRIWQLTRGAGQRVAVIDTGVRRHPRLSKLVAGGDYVSTGDGTQDCDAHGTLVAGIIAAKPAPEADRFTGVAPDVTVIGVRQSSTRFSLAGDHTGAGVGDVGTLAKAVRTAADLGASVINISSVACVAAADAPDDRALGAALAYAVDVKDAVVVAAAGNTGGATQCPGQPADVSYDNIATVVSPAWYDDYVLTVGSVTPQGAPSSFTLAGPWVDVAATGEGVTSLSPVNDGIVNSVAGQQLCGTSFAAPVVSGLAALIRARFPALTAREVMQRIESTAHHPAAGWDPFVGNGAVDALAAVSTATTERSGTAGRRILGLPGPATPGQPDNRPRDTAFGGAAICLVALLATMASLMRRRLGSNRVAAD
ncbi:type VII secretion-associated serine protease mycosin [Mycobacterium asiaticum]|uniref:Type VII secretion-associated serine protease mycosin n=1 Tax=Mycobacterium asiaticum TaxID=1790 RepID=A0A1A3MZ26_MYCAS|nr:type VII secretion-associated serine protease mycosin [Mycobacterium asiaticum]OBK15163.1 type VII secretion-associated serine protease mycosin [Mycobacterium asiaticum]